MNKPAWEKFLETLSYEKLMGATPLVLLEWFYEWLFENGYITEKEQ